MDWYNQKSSKEEKEVNDKKKVENGGNNVVNTKKEYHPRNSFYGDYNFMNYQYNSNDDSIWSPKKEEMKYDIKPSHGSFTPPPNMRNREGIIQIDSKRSITPKNNSSRIFNNINPYRMQPRRIGSGLGLNMMNPTLQSQALIKKGVGAVKCIFLPCQPTGRGKFAKQLSAREIKIEPYPQTKRDLEKFFERLGLFEAPTEDKPSLKLQFFIVSKAKPVVTFRKSEGMQPWKVTNKLCEEWICDERFKRFYGPVVLLNLSNCYSFAANSTGDCSHMKLALSDYTMNDYREQMDKNQKKFVEIQSEKYPSGMQINSFDRSLRDDDDEVDIFTETNKHIDEFMSENEKDDFGQYEEKINMVSQVQAPVKTVSPVTNEEMRKLKLVMDSSFDKIIEELKKLAPSERWENVFRINFKMKYEILREYVKVVTKLSVYKKKYSVVKNSSNKDLVIVNTGLYSLENPIVLLYDLKKSRIDSVLTWEAIEKKFQMYNDDPPEFYYGDIIGFDLAFRTFKEMNLAWRDVNLSRLYDKYKYLFPKYITYMKEHDRAMYLNGIKYSYMLRFMDDDENKSASISSLSSLDNWSISHLLPLSFNGEDENAFLAVEVQKIQNSNTMVCTNLLTYDEAWLKIRLMGIHNQSSWLDHPKFRGISFNKKMKNEKELKDTFNEIRSKLTEPMSKEKMFDVLYLEQRNDKYVVYPRKIIKQFSEHEVMENNSSKKLIEKIKAILEKKKYKCSIQSESLEFLNLKTDYKRILLTGKSSKSGKSNSKGSKSSSKGSKSSKGSSKSSVKSKGKKK